MGSNLKATRQRMLDSRDAAIITMRKAMADESLIPAFVDQLAHYAADKISENLRNELESIRRLVDATGDETTHHAVKRIINERNSLAATYRDVRKQLGFAHDKIRVFEGRVATKKSDDLSHKTKE